MVMGSTGEVGEVIALLNLASMGKGGGRNHPAQHRPTGVAGRPQGMEGYRCHTLAAYRPETLRRGRVRRRAAYRE